MISSVNNTSQAFTAIKQAADSQKLETAVLKKAHENLKAEGASTLKLLEASSVSPASKHGIDTFV